ncbi:MAG: hypothetical protein HOI76_02150 [Microbacteriaceae bacterium]|nr:hypothetical protein [Microbacteriaceae bacterium]
MSRTPSPTSAQFPRSITWLGLLILGAGVTYGPMSSASALLGISAAAVATAGGLFAAVRRRRNRQEHSGEAR